MKARRSLQFSTGFRESATIPQFFSKQLYLSSTHPEKIRPQDHIFSEKWGKCAPNPTSQIWSAEQIKNHFHIIFQLISKKD